MSWRTLAACGIVFALLWVLLPAPGPPGVGTARAQDDAEAAEAPAEQGEAEADAEKEEPWQPPVPASADERVEDRHRMVRTQMAEPADGRDPIESDTVLEAMRTVPRHAFVPGRMKGRAYTDSPLPIGHGQTISQPYIVAMMTEQLEVTPQMKVLEIGTGSGYQAAVLAQLTPEVYSIEIIDDLAERAAGWLEDEGYDDVRTRPGDGYWGWEDHAPFDAIIVTCAAGHLPPPLWDQLKPGGRMIIPIGGPYEVQRLVLVSKTEDGRRRSKMITAVRFVPMTGEIRER